MGFDSSLGHSWQLTAIGRLIMSKRTYTKFNKQDFENCLDKTDENFREVEHGWTEELVYESRSDDGRFIMRVYSSLDKRTGRARDKGTDAIRLVVLDDETERPVLKEKRTNRIQTWCKNLRSKIENIGNRRDELVFCSRCDSVMVIRKNKSSGNEFYGCSSYPDCKNTEPL